MSQNTVLCPVLPNLPLLYVGVDVAKATLMLSVLGEATELENTPKGHTQLLKQLSEAGRAVHVVLEATGGFEAALVRLLQAAGLPVSVLLPSRVRNFAHAKGLRAKTDPIDAHLLAAFGEAIKPPVTQSPTEPQRLLAELVTRRTQLVQTRVAEQNRAAHYTDRMAQRQSASLLALLKKQIRQCDQGFLAHIAADPELKAKAVRLQEVPGVGPVTTAILLSHLPELGTLSDEEAAALAGLAPYNQDSGPHKGTRRISGGRKEVRGALYMAALTAVRRDAILRAFYQKLCKAGKKPIVALTAAMRKLVVLLNRLLAKPDFKLTPNPPPTPPQAA